MDLPDISVEGERFVAFSKTIKSEVTNKGGVLGNKECAWIVKRSYIYCVSLRNGQTTSFFDLSNIGYHEISEIKSVEYFCTQADELMLAVALKTHEKYKQTLIAILSVEQNAIISCIEVSACVSSISFLQVIECRRSLLQYFDGCLALGCEDGGVVLIDLKLADSPITNSEQSLISSSVIYNYDIPLSTIRQKFLKCHQDGIHMAIQMEALETSCSVRSVHCISRILGLCVGYDDGTLALYDLLEMQLITIVQPVHGIIPLVSISSMEPTDDPRPCLYLWAVHQNDDILTGVLHVIMYENQLIDCTGSETFENFQICSVRHQLILEEESTTAVACQSILNVNRHNEDDVSSLCAISWFSKRQGQNKLLLFDLNQWYKEEMPLESIGNPTYIAVYLLKGDRKSLKLHVKPNTITHFNSMQRFEEHFYPNSISFECVVLYADGYRIHNWEGAQNKLINVIRSKNSSILFDPSSYFNEIIRTGLIPHFTDINANSNFSQQFMQEVLLSFALENNCYNILRDSAKYWTDRICVYGVDGSTGLSLTFLIEWSWKRVTAIKRRCNQLCNGLFTCQGYPLDNREQKELGFLSRQLKLLVDFLNDIIKNSKFAEKDLIKKHKTLQLSAEYYEILLWMLTNSLLPESLYNRNNNSSTESVPYPYSHLQRIYTEKRNFFYKINQSLISKKTGSCRLIFIDSFIEHECKGSSLHEFWLENDSNGLYPPVSLEAMLRVMLVPDLDFQSKCSILLYFFLDLHMIIDENAFKNAIDSFKKFPTVFKIPSHLVKTIQCFWNLDHGNLLTAVDEFISPFHNNQLLPQWNNELFVESLLMQNAMKLALRVLDSCPAISPVLKIKTLLFNNQMNEAFHLARHKTENDSLLKLFFSWCVCSGKYSMLRELALDDRESQLLHNIIKQSKTEQSETLHFAYLLQRAKYVDAISYMDELSKSKGIQHYEVNDYIKSSDEKYMNGPNLLLSAFNSTLTPVTQCLTDVYFRIKNKLKKKDNIPNSPSPFSCQLIKQNANNLLGGIYHSSALSAQFASAYWNGSNYVKKHDANVFVSQNAPFLSKPQSATYYLDNITNDISYPVAYKIAEKRSISKCELSRCYEDPEPNISLECNPKKRRRFCSEINEDMKKTAEQSKLIKSYYNRKTEEDTDISSQSCFTKPFSSNLNGQHFKNTIETRTQRELQGILKTYSEERNGSVQCLVEEDKNLRFQLPYVVNLEESISVDKSDSLKESTLPAADITTTINSCRLAKLSYEKSSFALNSPFCTKEKSPENEVVKHIDKNILTPSPNVGRSHKTATIDSREQFFTALEGPAENVAQNFHHSTTPFATSTTYAILEKCEDETKNKDPSETSKEDVSKSKDSPGEGLSFIDNDNELPSNLDSSPKHNKNESKQNKSYVKLSECSTVIGTITDNELGVDSVKTSYFDCSNRNSESTGDRKQYHCVDTTLGMTSYDHTESNARRLLHQTTNLAEYEAKDSYNNLDRLESKTSETKVPDVLDDQKLIFKDDLNSPKKISPVKIEILENINLSSLRNEADKKETFVVDTQNLSASDKSPLRTYDSHIETPRKNTTRKTKSTSNTLKSDITKEMKNYRGVSEPPESSTNSNKQNVTKSKERGTSVPPIGQKEKKQSRVCLNSINEEDIICDSPSSRTRSRMRLNSIDFDLSTTLEQLPQRTRRSSISKSSLDTLKPTTRKRSLSVNNESCKEDSTGNAETVIKKKIEKSNQKSRSKLTGKSTESPERQKKFVRKSGSSNPSEEKEFDQKNTETMSKSLLLSRRLTRKQLALFEKSSDEQSSNLDVSDLERSKDEYFFSKVAESDTDETASLTSTTSTKSNTKFNRRLTRSSLKQMTDSDEFLAISSIKSYELSKKQIIRDIAERNTTPENQEHEAVGKSLKAISPKRKNSRSAKK